MRMTIAEITNTYGVKMGLIQLGLNDLAEKWAEQKRYKKSVVKMHSVMPIEDRPVDVQEKLAECYLIQSESWDIITNFSDKEVDFQL
jgi:hypothetical protein